MGVTTQFYFLKISNLQNQNHPLGSLLRWLTVWLGGRYRACRAREIMQHCHAGVICKRGICQGVFVILFLFAKILFYFIPVHFLMGEDGEERNGPHHAQCPGHGEEREQCRAPPALSCQQPSSIIKPGEKSPPNSKMWHAKTTFILLIPLSWTSILVMSEIQTLIYKFCIFVFFHFNMLTDQNNQQARWITAKFKIW